MNSKILHDLFIQANAAILFSVILLSNVFAAPADKIFNGINKNIDSGELSEDIRGAGVLGYYEARELIRLAIIKSRCDVVEMLLDTSPTRILHDEPEANGGLVNLAIEKNEHLCVRAFMEKGVDPNRVEVGSGESGFTIYYLLVDNYIKKPSQEFYLIMREMLKAGANSNSINGRFYTPLSLAVEAGDEKSVELMIESGVDLLFHSGPFFSLPIEIADRRNNERMVDLLAASGGVPCANRQQVKLLLEKNSISTHLKSKLLECDIRR